VQLPHEHLARLKEEEEEDRKVKFESDDGLDLVLSKLIGSEVSNLSDA